MQARRSGGLQPSIRALGVVLAVAAIRLLAACGGDAASDPDAALADGAAAGDAAVDGGAIDAGAERDAGSTPACASDAACDDDDPCTADSCDVATGCVHRRTYACGPAIVVTSPARGAAVSAPPGTTEVTVRGQVTSGAAPITTFTVNGVAVPLDASGGFTSTVPAHEGTNVLVLEAVDALGQARRRVQAFLWSSHYRDPSDASTMAGAVDEGVALWLGPGAIDDGDPASPIDDLAATIAPLAARIDLPAVYPPSSPVTSLAGYNVYVTSITSSATRTRLIPAAGGLDLEVTVAGVDARLAFDCTIPACTLAGGDGTGRLAADAIVARAPLEIRVLPDHTLEVAAGTPTTSIDGLTVSSDQAWTNFLVSTTRSAVEERASRIGTEVVASAPTVLDAALSSLAGNTTQTRTTLDGRALVYEDRSDFSSVTASPAGLTLVLRSGSYASATPPYVGLAVPSLLGCVGGAPVPPALAAVAEVEQAIHLDAANQQSFAAWRAGLLELTLPAGLVDPSGRPVDGLVVRVSAMLAPTLDDCGPGGALRMVLGDLRVELELAYAGTPVTATAYAGITSEVGVESDGRALAFRIIGAPTISLEVTAADAEGAAYDAQVAPIVTDVVRLVLASLASEPLARIAHPALDGGGVVPEVPSRTGLGLSPAATTTRIPNGARVAGQADALR